MKASVVDLRYKTKDILQALDRMEDVEISYRGKPKGILKPATHGTTGRSIQDHPFFGSAPKVSGSVEEEMKTLRSGRYGDI